MESVLFFMTPKVMCAYLYDDFTLRQALEKMEQARYTALPILNRKGEYCGSMTEGDLLWALKNKCGMDIRKAEEHRIMEVPHKRDNIPVKVTTTMHDLVNRAAEQNFIPVVDDYNAFIGIVTRRSIMQYCRKQLFPGD